MKISKARTDLWSSTIKLRDKPPINNHQSVTCVPRLDDTSTHRLTLNMQSTYILVLRTLLRDQRPFLLLLLLILILLLSLTSWNLNAPETQCGGGERVSTGREVRENPAARTHYSPINKLKCNTDMWGMEQTNSREILGGEQKEAEKADSTEINPTTCWWGEGTVLHLIVGDGVQQWNLLWISSTCHRFPLLLLHCCQNPSQ